MNMSSKNPFLDSHEELVNHKIPENPFEDDTTDDYESSKNPFLNDMTLEDVEASINLPSSRKESTSKSKELEQHLLKVDKNSLENKSLDSSHLQRSKNKRVSIDIEAAPSTVRHAANRFMDVPSLKATRPSTSRISGSEPSISLTRNSDKNQRQQRKGSFSMDNTPFRSLQAQRKNSGAAPSRITANDVAGMIEKLMEANLSTRRYQNESIWHKSTSNLKVTLQTVPRNIPPRKYTSNINPDLLPINDDESDAKTSSTSFTITKSKSSSEHLPKYIEWKKLAWSIPLQRKWDKITQTGKMYTTKAHEPVQIRYAPVDSNEDLTSDVIASHHIPITIPTQIMHMANQYPNRKALMDREETGIWTALTYNESLQLVEQLASSFLSANITPGATVIIASKTTTKSLILCLLGCVFAALPVIITSTFSDLHGSVAKYLVKQGNTEVIICDKNEDVLRITKHIAELPTIKVIVNMESKAMSAHQASSRATIYSYPMWLNLGLNVLKTTLTAYMNKNLSPNKIAIIKPQYFSLIGNTQNPTKFKDDAQVKSVMITHDNLVFTTRHVFRVIKIMNGKERWITHLTWPQAVCVDIIPALLLGVTVYISPGFETVERLFKYCREVKPTLFLTTTNMWQALIENVITTEEKTENTRSLGHQIRVWAKAQGRNTGPFLSAGTYKTIGLKDRLKFHIAELLLFRKIRNRMGLSEAYSGVMMQLKATNDKPRMFRLSVGHEEVDESTKEYMKTFNLPVLTWFWLNELGTIAIQKERSSQQTSPYNQGLLLEELYCITERTPLNEDEVELCFAGRGIFAGYLGNEKAVTSKLTQQGRYYRSGAQGAKLRRQLLINKRLDHYLIMSSGNAVEYMPIEKKFSMLIGPKLIQDCVLIGEGLNCLIILMSFKTIRGTHDLHDSVINWFKKLGSHSKFVEEVTYYKDKLVRNAILRVIAEINELLHSHEEIITSFAILPRPLEEGIEIDDTGRIRRHVVCKVFQTLISKAAAKRWNTLIG